MEEDAIRVDATWTPRSISFTVGSRFPNVLVFEIVAAKHIILTGSDNCLVKVFLRELGSKNCVNPFSAAG